MSELTVLFFAILFKSLTICACIAGIVFLIHTDKQGWGWLVFLAILIGSTSYKYHPDEPPKKETKETQIA